MNLKRIKDDAREDYENYLKTTPEGQKNSAAMARLENWAEHFEPTLLSEDWQDDEHCVVVVGDKNSSVQMTINCIGTYNEGLLDWGIIDTYDHRKNWKNLPDDDWFLVNAIRIKLTHDDKLGTDLLYTIDDFLGENLIFGSDEDEFDDEIADSRRVSDSKDNVRAAIQEMLVERGLDSEVDINDVDINYYGEDSDEVAEAELCNGCVCHVFQDEQDAYDFVKNPDNVQFTDYLEGAQSDEDWIDYLIKGGVDADKAAELVETGNWQAIKEIILDSDGAEWFLGEYSGDMFYPEVGYVIYF